MRLHVGYVGEREVPLIFLSFNLVRKITSCQSVLRNHCAPFFKSFRGISSEGVIIVCSKN